MLTHMNLLSSELDAMGTFSSPEQQWTADKNSFV